MSTEASIIAQSRSNAAKQYLAQQFEQMTARLQQYVARRCPKCSCPESYVLKTIPQQGTKRLECRGCHHRWTVRG